MRYRRFRQPAETDGHKIRVSLGGADKNNKKNTVKSRQSLSNAAQARRHSALDAAYKWTVTTVLHSGAVGVALILFAAVYWATKLQQPQLAPSLFSYMSIQYGLAVFLLTIGMVAFPLFLPTLIVRRRPKKPKLLTTPKQGMPKRLYAFNIVTSLTVGLWELIAGLCPTTSYWLILLLITLTLTFYVVRFQRNPNYRLINYWRHIWMRLSRPQYLGIVLRFRRLSRRFIMTTCSASTLLFAAIYPVLVIYIVFPHLFDRVAWNEINNPYVSACIVAFINFISLSIYSTLSTDNTTPTAVLITLALVLLVVNEISGYSNKLLTSVYGGYANTFTFDLVSAKRVFIKPTKTFSWTPDKIPVHCVGNTDTVTWRHRGVLYFSCHNPTSGDTALKNIRFYGKDYINKSGLADFSRLTLAPHLSKPRPICYVLNSYNKNKDDKLLCTTNEFSP